MANLLGQNIGTNYKGILNLNTLNGNLSGTLQAVTDGDGNASLLKLSTTELRIDSGVTNRRLTFGSNGQMNFVNDNDFIIDYSTGSSNIFRLSYSGTAVKLNSDAYQFATYSGGTIYANLQSAGLAIGLGATAASARLQVKGDGTTASTNSLIIQNGGGTNLFRVRDDGSIFCEGGGGLSSTGIIGTAYGLFGGASYEPSASLVCGGTTTGFLPARMTTTQVNAISSPATGLVVYSTTLNKLAVYTGSAWETVTSI
jgi:hypothetical protein